MSATTSIEWTDVVWNPVTGCSKVSEGCRHCYAEGVAHRFWGDRPFTEVRCHADRLATPMHWKKPRRIFVNSMSDLFHEDVPDAFIAAVFGVMAACPLHTFQILTKRPARMLAWSRWLGESGGIGPYIRSIRIDGDRTIPSLFNAVARTEMVHGQRHRAVNDPWMTVFNAAACMGSCPLPNVWLGVSIEDQATADERILMLLQTPAAVRWVSAEPLLGPISFDVPWPPGFPQRIDPQGNHFDALRFDDCNSLEPLGHLDWVVVGGESGPGARPCDLAWIRSIVQQGKTAGVPVFVKQLGATPVCSNSIGINDGELGYEWKLKDLKGGDPSEWPADLHVREWPR